MRTGAAADHAGCFHAAMYYGSEAELAEALVPFLLDGVATGEPTLVSAREGVSSVLRAALPADSGVGFLPGEEYYARPAVTIRAYRKLLAEYVAEGFEQVRVVGEVPAEAATWDWWARYEAVINEAYDEFPVWGVCTYDTRSTPSWILDDVARTHPRFAERDGAHRASPSYAPAALLGERRVPAADPLQAGPPVFELRDPNVAFVRQALAAHHGGVLSAAAFGDFQVAVDEVTTNAIEHGLPPVTVRLWRGETRLVVTVTDGGAGPTDPAAGLLPAAKARWAASASGWPTSCATTSPSAPVRTAGAPSGSPPASRPGGRPPRFRLCARRFRRVTPGSTLRIQVNGTCVPLRTQRDDHHPCGGLLPGW